MIPLTKQLAEHEELEKIGWQIRLAGMGTVKKDFVDVRYL
jgi:hypothetical protein